MWHALRSSPPEDVAQRPTLRKTGQKSHSRPYSFDGNASRNDSKIEMSSMSASLDLGVSVAALVSQ
jgi:hypothetical protein